MTYTHDELRWAINDERRYWANPDNYYHDEYNSAVNRSFLTFITVLSLSVVYANFGLIGVMMTVSIAMGGTFATLVALWVVLTILFEVIPSMFNWLRGR